MEILDFVADDPGLTHYVEAILDRNTERADIADHLSLPVTDVDNLRKRMRRRLEAHYMGRNKNGG